MRTRATHLLLLRLLMGGLGLLLASRLAAQTVTHIAGGAITSFFVKSDGSLWGMGDNTYGELGLGPGLTQTNVPQEIVTNGVGMVAASYHTLFQQGNAIWAMGDNEYGELGDGTTNNHYVPERVVLLAPQFYLSAIAAGGYHSLFAPTRDFMGTGTGLEAMGWNYFGQLGDGTTSNRVSPETVTSIGSGAISSVAGGYDHSLFVLPDGSLGGMGDNIFGELGIGSTPTYTSDQVEIVSNEVVTVAAGYGDSFLIKSDGSLWAMGYNGFGQLGDGTFNNTNRPEQVLTGVVAVAAGSFHAICIRSDGTLWGAGQNSLGQLGLGDEQDVQDWAPIGVSNVVAIAAGLEYSLFIKSDGSLWGMGYNYSGQLGTGDNTTRYVPVEIVPPPSPTISSITLADGNIVVTWPTNQGGFYLQTSSSVGPSAAWSAVSPGVIVNGQYTVTNPISASQQFYRLGE